MFFFSSWKFILYVKKKKACLKCANPLTAHLPCQRRAAHFLCIPPKRRTGSIPSCACACAGPPRGLDQSVGTSPDPQSWDSVPNSSSPAGGAGARGQPGLCI